MDDVDTPIDGFNVSEILVSGISRDKLRILRKVKSESWCYSDHAVTISDRSVGWLDCRMNDQEPTVSSKLFVYGANDGSIQRCDSVRLVPTIRGNQHQHSAFTRFGQLARA